MIENENEAHQTQKKLLEKIIEEMKQENSD